uniref:Uncharacterized protein n=1 Tax=Timema genevievae TaxID=629358 RepID=A0A7R9K2W6_TIMGE|nr:unnamed protein product [Timema genevievae]
MERREVILTAVFSTLAALASLAVLLFICYWWHHKRKRKRDEENTEDADASTPSMTTRMDGGGGGSGNSKEGRKNGFLSLRTPLISTKTLGCQPRNGPLTSYKNVRTLAEAPEGV